ncbi:MAG: tRNA (adenosine(37)-N6)-threonylcarbamoyltransferase complex dimerization subunit type 1 TsaB [Spirosomataceae bacterium]
MLILSIDTSTKVCSVALHQQGQLLASYELYTEKSHSGMLTSLIQQAVAHTGHELQQLDAIAVAKGPGSYTGLRIGVSTAKGLCFALDKPLLAVNTLEAMAWQLKGLYASAWLCPMLDARRMEVYCAVYDAQGNVVSPTEAKIINEQSFEELLSKNRVIFFGEGAAKCKAMLAHQAHAVFPETGVTPSAKTVGLLAAQAFHNQQFEDVVSFEPFYLKEFVSTSSLR